MTAEPSLGGLPVVVVGDVHGDIERLFKALASYPPERWHTVFLGDLVDGGPFGVGALRFARDRPNSTVLLGNHEVAMLWALRDRSHLASWMGLGGEMHDLRELEKDRALEAWMRSRPLLLKLADGTLLQHSDNDLYKKLARHDEPDLVDAVNTEGRRLLESGNEMALWEILTPGLVFRTSRRRLEEWLELTGSRRLVHGHKPHGRPRPDTYQYGLVVNFDGGLSRFGRSKYKKQGPIEASVGPIPDW